MIDGTEDERMKKLLGENTTVQRTTARLDEIRSNHPDDDDIGFLLDLVEQFLKASDDVIQSSRPYVTRFNAFLISTDSWENLSKLVTPGHLEMDKLFGEMHKSEILSLVQEKDSETGLDDNTRKNSDE